MLGDFQKLSLSNESLIEKMRKKPKSNYKNHGPIKSNEAPNNKGQKKSLTRNNQETWAKENQN